MMFKYMRFEKQKNECYLIFKYHNSVFKRTFINGKKTLLGKQILIINNNELFPGGIILKPYKLVVGFFVVAVLYDI